MIQNILMKNMVFHHLNYIKLGQAKKIEYCHITSKKKHKDKKYSIEIQVDRQKSFNGVAKNINQPVCIMNLKAKDVVNKTYKFHTFEINEEDLNYVEDQFKKIEQTINALLL